MAKVGKFSRGRIRSLLKLQKGRCAVTGEKLDPNNATADHIFPLSKMSQIEKNDKNIWIVLKKINSLKSNLSMKELYELCEKILAYKSKSEEIIKKINSNKIDNMTVEEFDKYIDKNYDEKGVIKD